MNRAIMPLGLKMDPSRGLLVAIDLQWENINMAFCSKTTRLRDFIFCV